MDCDEKMEEMLNKKRKSSVKEKFKKNITSILFLFIVSQVFIFVSNEVRAYYVEIDIVGILESDITSFNYNSSTDLVKFNIETRNRGSIGYSARTRLDILKTSESNETYEIFTAWSPEKILMPGDKKSSELYWSTNSTGDFTVRIRVYYAGEILENFFEVEKKESVVLSNLIEKDVFDIKNFRTYDNFVIFDLVSKRDAKDVVIIPAAFKKGWVFEQEKINFLKQDISKTIILPYQTGAFVDHDLTLLIVSGDSKLYSEKPVTLTKKQGIEGFVFSMIDSLKIFLRC